MVVREAMAGYFRRLAEDHPLRRTCEIEDVDPLLFTSEPDEDGYVAWQPHEKASPSDFTAIERRAGALLHSSVKDYYNSFWFMAMGGRFREHGVTLDPVIPGRELADLETHLFGGQYGTGYLAVHGGRLDYVPIGLHHPSDLLLVVNNLTGEVAVEDWERGSFRLIAKHLVELISELQSDLR